MENCPICSMKPGERSVQSPFAPSLCWLETSKTENNLVQMRFGYGDDFEHIIYMPKFCPECGAKIIAEKVNDKQKPQSKSGRREIDRIKHSKDIANSIIINEKINHEKIRQENEHGDEYGPFPQQNLYYFCELEDGRGICFFYNQNTIQVVLPGGESEYIDNIELLFDAGNDVYKNDRKNEIAPGVFKQAYVSCDKNFNGNRKYITKEEAELISKEASNIVATFVKSAKKLGYLV